MYEPQNLQRWTLPECYIGEHFPDYYVGPCGVHRDSDVLAKANWEALCKAIPEDGERVKVVTAMHWAVGWVSWLAIHKDNDDALREADEIAAALENYPVVDDELYSQMENDENEEDWRNMGVKDRLALYRRYGYDGGDLAALLRAILRGDWTAAYDTLNDAYEVMYRWRN